MSISKKIFSYIFLIFTVALIVNLSKDVWRLLHAGERVDETEEKLANLKAENQELKESLQYYESEDFKEAEIRNKLQMAKPDEVVIVLPDELNLYSATTSPSLLEDKNKKELRNWEKWLQLFI